MTITVETLKRKLSPKPPVDGDHRTLHTGDEPVMLQTEERTIRPSPAGLVGPRGRDESGEPVHIAPGLPPTQEPGGWGEIGRIDKDGAFNRRVEPALTTRIGPILISALPVELQAGHPVRTLIVDNYSASWLYFPAMGRYVAPYIEHCCFPVSTGPQTIRVVSEAPPGFTNPAAAVGTGFLAIGVETELPFSPGTPIQTQGGAPTGAPATLVTVVNPSTAGQAQASVGSVGTLLKNPAAATFDPWEEIAGQGDGLGVGQAMQPSSTPSTVTSAVGGTASITVAAVAGQSHRLTSIIASGVPTFTLPASVTVADGASTVYAWGVGQAQVEPEPNLPPGGLKMTAGNSMTATAPSSGAATTSIMSIAKLTA